MNVCVCGIVGCEMKVQFDDVYKSDILIDVETTRIISLTQHNP